VAHIDRLLLLADDFDGAVKSGDLGPEHAADAVAMRAAAIALVGGGRCSFCQWVSEGLTTVQARDAAMQEHIRQCEKHPLAAVTAERDALREQLRVLKGEQQAPRAGAAAIDLRCPPLLAEALRKKARKAMRDAGMGDALVRVDARALLDILDVAESRAPEGK
jgi:hypothetical protein